MKTKFNGFLTLLLALAVQIAFAQEKTVTGTVSDASGPLPGVTVIVKGTQTGTQTDFDGNYSISANTGAVLQFSFMGMLTVEQTVGASNTINVVMQESAEALEEVVVTALGIKREKKSLGYSTQEVKGDDVNTAKDQSFINSLSGKVAGLDIKKSNSLGGSVNAILRGSNSFTNSNQALFVVDGIPISNSNYNREFQDIGDGGYDYGNAASDINPDDIESISVLKGATASALYGSLAANGVILITTKKGSSQEGIGVTINNTITLTNVDKETFPTYQKEYGAGYGPYYGSTQGNGGFYSTDVDGDGVDDLLVPTGEDASFGAAYDPNLLVYQWYSLFPSLDGVVGGGYLQPTPWTAPKNEPISIFETGLSNVLSVTLDGGNADGTFRLGFTNDDRQGILPNSLIKKDIIDFSGSYNLNEKLTVTGKATYSKISGRGRYGTGYDSGNIFQSFRQWFQSNTDVQDQKLAYLATGQNISWNTNSDTDLTPHYFDNPYFVLYENYETDSRNRFFGKAQLDYEFNDWMSGIFRVAVDSYTDLQEERKNIGSLDQSYYNKLNRQFEQYSYDFIVRVNKDISESISFNGLIGSSVSTIKFNSTLAETNGGLVNPGLYSLSNSVSALSPPTEQDYSIRKLGHFVQASFGYNDMLYLDGTFRIDESSTLPGDDNVYNYPSVSTSFLFSEVLEKDWLSFGKFRLSYAKVTNDAPIYSVNNTVSASDPFGSSPVYFVDDTSQNPNLRPESTTEFEAGIESRLFNNKLGFELSLYKKNTVDQILPVQVSTATGFNFKYVNAGEMENKGIELSLYGSPIKKDDFEWNVNINWAKNSNEVLSLFEDGENLLIFSQWSTAINARVGEPYGSITGTNYFYDSATGKKVIGDDGKYLATSSTTEVIGNVQPDWFGGIQNSFRYKNFSFGFLIDIQKGGDIINYDWAFGNATGIYATSAGLNELGNPVRDLVSNGGGVLLDGVTVGGSPNTTRGEAFDYENPLGYYGGSYDDGGTAYDAGASGYIPDANFVFDASYVKLREATISYMLPKSITDKFSLNSLSLGVTGRNLWIIHKNLPFGDPESNPSNGNSQGIQNAALPGTRDVSFNITVQF